MVDCILHCFKQPYNQVVKLNEYDFVDEVNYFSFLLESEIELTHFIVLINNTAFKIVKIKEYNNKFWYGLDYNSVKEYFSSQDFNDIAFTNYTSEFELEIIKDRISFYKLFINYPIGLCVIDLYDSIKNEDIISFNLNIVSAKIDEKEFESLVGYIESRGISIWTKNSLVKHSADKFNKEDKTDWLITFCESFVKKLKENYIHFFSFDKIRIIKPKNEIVSYSSELSTSDESMSWLINNLDVLNPTSVYDLNKVVVRNRLFSPSEILASELEESTDNNENQLVHGYINELHQFLVELQAKIEELKKKYSEKRTFEMIIEFYSNVRNFNRIQKVLNSLTDVKYYLDKHIPVRVESLDFLFTNKIETKEHYSFIYNNLIEWLLYKDAIFSKDKMLFKGITRMDQLFERACFFKLIDSFETNGFDYEVITFDCLYFPNKVKMTKGGVVHYLYFELIPERLITIKKGSGKLKPDFFIELENGSYIIIDAKYKKSNNIIKYDYQDLVLKYLHGIGFNDGGFFNPMGLYVLFPGLRNEIDFYQKKEYDLFSRNPAFPSIGIIGLNFENDSALLNESIKKLLQFS